MLDGVPARRVLAGRLLHPSLMADIPRRLFTCAASSHGVLTSFHLVSPADLIRPHLTWQSFHPDWVSAPWLVAATV